MQKETKHLCSCMEGEGKKNRTYLPKVNAAVNNMPHLPQLGVHSVLGRGCDIKI